MTSFGYRFNPRYAIKECSSCGTLYTRNCVCSIGAVEDKILVPKPPKNGARCTRTPDSHTQFHCFHCKEMLRDGETCKRCTCAKCGSGLSKGFCYICGHNQNSLNDSPRISETSSQNPPNINQCCYECGDPLDGIFCKRCTWMCSSPKKIKEDLFTYCIENGILQDSSEPSNDNTNVANALRELFVGNQDPDIFCHQCTCELCGKCDHYGYDFPPKVPVVPTPEPFNNQTVDELLQTLLSFDQTCYSEDGNSFTYDSTSNLVHNSPNVFSPALQPSIYS
uniref:Uncharacterized protein n=1 Tax=Tanacetum cinerariifolium TaxID=118510 RepID=A0A699KHB0_TANCI|nr:hypothetical protein [Tanacetum cinerariifolium]